MPGSAGMPCFAAVESGMERLWKKWGMALCRNGAASMMLRAHVSKLRHGAPLRRLFCAAGKRGGETWNLRVDRAYAWAAAAV
jgi:hypothetical protein